MSEQDMSEPQMRLVQIGTLRVKTAHTIRESTLMHGYGSVCAEHKDATPSKAQCGGCRDDYYNHGNTSFNNQGCWNFGTAVVVDKVGHSSRHVGYGPDVVMRKTLSCWHAVI